VGRRGSGGEVEYDGGIALGGEVQRRWGRRCAAAPTLSGDERWSAIWEFFLGI
jgi:hypothetical protein